MLCSLCSVRNPISKIVNQKEYLQCLNCKAIFLSPSHYLDPQSEKARYEHHNNDVNDPDYQKFVQPIVDQVLVNHDSDSTGLDYGCGTGPVITSELSKKGISLQLYDLYFRPDEAVFYQTYDFIVCCEVMEHFQQPFEEFKRLHSLLNPGGKLYCKTSLYRTNIDFEDWYYKDDPTHVTFYTTKSLDYLKERLGFSGLRILPEVIILTR